MKESMLIQYAKRTIACMLMLVFSLTSFSVKAADVYTNEELSSFDENIRLLSAFGLIDKGREAATTIKRGDFASVMLKYLGYGDEFYYTGTAFSDVPGEKNPIYGMFELGLMDGYSDGTFHPDDDILLEQAVKVIVTALGYKPIADIKGGYPNGYNACANNMDLFKGVSAQPRNILTYYNLVQMMVNALTVELVETDLRGGYLATDETWLSSRLDAEKRKGVVTAAQGIAATEKGSEGENTITVDGYVYEIDGDYSHLVGCYTEFYVNSEDKIIYITEKRTEKQEFQAEDLVSYSGKTYTVETENGKEKKYKLSQDSYIIFNGAAADSLTEEDMCPKYGKVTLIDNDNDNKYDTVLIESFNIYVVHSINKEEKVIYYTNGAGTFLDFGELDDKDLTVLNASGQTIDFEKIGVDSVIRTAVSKNNEKAKIIVSTATVTGTVTGMSEDEIYIDKVPYKFIDELIDKATTNVGRSGIFYLDSDGMIASISGGDNSWSYGYLINAYIDEDGSTLGVTIFDSKGEKLRLKGASKITVDGIKNQQDQRVVEILKKGTGSVVKQVVRFKCNSKGELVELDTPYNSASDINAAPSSDESEDSLRLIYAGNGYYMSQMHNFSGKVNVGSDTIFFSVTGDSDEDYEVKRVSDIPNETDFLMEAYSDNENEFYANLLFSSDKTIARGGGEFIGVVGKVAESINEDEEIVTCISFNSKNFDKDLLMETKLANAFPYSDTKEPMYALEPGDVIMLNYDGKNTARTVSLIYKPSENLFPAGSIYGSAGRQKWHYIYGSVYSLENGYVNITQKDISIDGAPSMSEVQSYKVSDFAKIYKYTDTIYGKGIVPATASDIVDYKNGSDSCSKVFAAGNWQYPNIMIIYE